MYTLGNLTAISATFFLRGPCSQLKSMFEQYRIAATLTFIGMMIITIIVASVDGIEDGLRGFLIVLCILLQFLAFTWYSISFIPYAQECIWGCIKGKCCPGS